MDVFASLYRVATVSDLQGGTFDGTALTQHTINENANGRQPAERMSESVKQI